MYVQINTKLTLVLVPNSLLYYLFDSDLKHGKETEMIARMQTIATNRVLVTIANQLDACWSHFLHVTPTQDSAGWGQSRKQNMMMISTHKDTNSHM